MNPALPAEPTAVFDRPYVVSWNLTYRCNLACEHCYLDAGPNPLVASDAFADRSELGTEECFAVADQIAQLAPECVTILTGGEPLLRRDILAIVAHAASRGLWVVVGTNGVRITENVASQLAANGARGVALSLDAVDGAAHDAFRNVRGAFANTVEAAHVLARVGMPFLIQTTVARHNVDDLEAIAELAHERLGAKVWNLYFLVPSGRGEYVSDLDPATYDGVLERLYHLQRRFSGRMLVNAKCAPHHVRTALAHDPDAPLPRTYAGGAGGCPAGTHYLGIRPNGDVTPCPYLPVFAGNLRSDSLGEIWTDSELFQRIRKRDSLGGRCGDCELKSACGGCRARAHGTSGDYMAADPLCAHEVGRFKDLPSIARRDEGYGERAAPGLRWDPAALERMKQIPAFVRGMVTRTVEAHCRERGITVIDERTLAEIRSRMPAARVFGKPERL
ncbi:MAG: radical SAM protein [bacterium]